MCADIRSIGWFVTLEYRVYAVLKSLAFAKMCLTESRLSDSDMSWSCLSQVMWCQQNACSTYVPASYKCRIWLPHFTVLCTVGGPTGGSTNERLSSGGIRSIRCFCTEAIVASSGGDDVDDDALSRLPIPFLSLLLRQTQGSYAYVEQLCGAL